MKVISHQDIINLNIPYSECYKWVEYIIKHKNEIILPPKISMKPSEGIFCNVMPSMSEQMGFSGVKIVTRYPQREPSLDSKLLLLDPSTGDFLAIMDANWITAMRTGGVAAYTVNKMAKNNYSFIGIIGLGNVARTTLNFILLTNPKRQLTIGLLKYKNQETQFIEEYQGYENVTFQLFDNSDDLVSHSDVVLSCVTYAANNFCNDKSFKEGVLVVPVHTLGFTNCDLFFDKVITDDIGHIKHFMNFNKFKSIIELSDIDSAKKCRSNNNERIIAYNIGISAQDLYFARKIYDLIKGPQLMTINLEEPHSKYWINR